MRVALTDIACRRAKPRAARYDVWDAIVPGLTLRVTPAGAKSWTVVSRYRRKPLRVTLGPYPALPLAGAREKARETLEALQMGRDPRYARTATNVATAFKEFAEGGKWTPEHRINLLSALRVYVEPAFGRMLVTEVRRRDVAELLERIAKKHPARANSVHGYLRAFFRSLLERDLIEESPVASVRRPAEHRSRDRVYSDAELRAIWSATDRALGWPYGPLVRFLLVTAQRRGQAMKMRWTDVDEARGIWTSATKEGRLHPLPLSELAAEILVACPRYDDGPYVFALMGARPATNIGIATDKVRAFPGAPSDFRLHDLRRTAATRMAELGVAPWVVDAILDHAAGGVTGVYQRYGYVEEMRHALSLWSDRLRVILAG